MFEEVGKLIYAHGGCKNRIAFVLERCLGDCDHLYFKWFMEADEFCFCEKRGQVFCCSPVMQRVCGSVCYAGNCI